MTRKNRLSLQRRAYGVGRELRDARHDPALAGICLVREKVAQIIMGIVAGNAVEDQPAREQRVPDLLGAGPAAGGEVVGIAVDVQQLEQAHAAQLLHFIEAEGPFPVRVVDLGQGGRRRRGRHPPRSAESAPGWRRWRRPRPGASGSGH